MNLNSYLFLKEYLKYKLNANDHDLIEMFKTYNEYYKKPSAETYLAIGRDFLSYIRKNKQEIETILGKECFQAEKESIRFAVKLFSDSNRMHTNEAFVKIVEYFSNNQTKILDVGGGGIPYSSILLAKNNDNVTAMDKLLLSETSLRDQNLSGKNQYFNEDTDISEYDMVVGCKPCDAIGQIIEKCKKASKPYILTICDCGAYDYAAKNGFFYDDEYASRWEDILPGVDRDIKFVSNYVTNLDVPKDKFREVVYANDGLHELGKIMADYSGAFLSAMNDDHSSEKIIKTPRGVIGFSYANVDAKWEKKNDEEEVKDK